MGFFSFKCTCRKPLLSYFAVGERIGPPWMSKVVVHYKDGKHVSGVYDGYGRILGDDDAHELEQDDSNGSYKAAGDVRHLACWVKDGMPKFKRQSPSASCQGWSFDGQNHMHLKPPLTEEEVQAALFRWLLSAQSALDNTAVE